MTEHRSSTIMSPKFRKVVERAQRDPKERFSSVAHCIDVDMLRNAFERIRKDAAIGVDGVTKEMYGQNLEENLQDLHNRLRTKRYRHQSIRRVHIPKGPGSKKTRPIGISTIEDKIVQGALSEVLGVLYEPVFLPCSYGFRPGLSPHDAMRAVYEMASREGVSWIVEADIQSFFDSIVRKKLQEMLKKRIADSSLMRLIGKCLHVGVLDGEDFTKPEEGTVQGSIISPLLGNVYLHYVLDEWFENRVCPGLIGRARLIRYADDFIIGFTHKRDAERAMEELVERMAEYGLTLHPDKTRLVRFTRPRWGKMPKPAPESFDFLGFTVFWTVIRKYESRPAMKTSKARLRRALAAWGEWCRRHRHRPLEEQHAALSTRLQGHMNYFGVNGNSRSLKQVRYWVERLWFKWLNRRSQRKSYTWERFNRYLRRFPLPSPKIRVAIWD